MTKEKFMETVGNYAVKHYQEHRILPSMTVAQAVLESDFGRSELGVKACNYFGMKWTKGCGCDYYEKKTAEQEKDGTYYVITAKFRKYDNMEDGLKGYYDFIESKPWYNNLKGVTNYKLSCKLIKEDGWATSINYTKNLIRIIENYDLTIYDDMALNNNTNATVVNKCNIYPNMNDWEKKIVTLKVDTRIEVVKDINNGWSKVKYGTKVGYVKNSALKHDSLYLSKYALRKTTDKVVLRSDRKVDKSTAVITIPKDTQFILLGKDDKWAKIKYENEIYYVWKAKTNVK